MAIDINELTSMLQKPAAYAAIKQQETKAKEAVPEFELDDDGEEYMAVGVDGVLASTEKLLAMNRGLVEPDERDSLKFQKILRPHAMLRESIKMDAGKVARTALYQAAKRKNLKGLQPGAFDSYVNRLLVGNPLTSPLEEINPMQLVANARRVTKMGPGGLGSDQSITEEAQNVHPSQFGFISCIEGPESARAGIDVRVAWGTKLGSNGRLYQKFFDRHKKRFVWLSPEDVDGLTIKLPD
jgi:DNA-directed RNA polymerase beta subunit